MAEGNINRRRNGRGKAATSSDLAEGARPAGGSRSRDEGSLAARRSPSPSGAIHFTPVPRKNTRHDGWSAENQRIFIDALAAGASVTRATRAAGRSLEGVYKLKAAPGAASFVAAWDKAIKQAAATVRDVYFDQCVNGVPEEVWHAGKKVGVRRRFNLRAMQWVLQHHMPETYGAGVRGLAKPPQKEDPWGNMVDADDADEAFRRQRVNIGVKELAERLGIML